MSYTGSSLAGPVPSALDWQSRPVGWQLGAMLAATLFLALASYVAVPMFPVPITMQTFAVTLVGALFGWRRGGIVITAWLIEGALGFPVLANGAAGAYHFLGPTGGYLFAFPAVGALVGWLAERGCNGHRIGLAFIAVLAAHMLCLAAGAAWLATTIGWLRAVVVGVEPFLLGALLKSGLVAATLGVIVKGRQHLAAR